VIAEADRHVFERLITRFIAPVRAAVGATASQRDEATGRMPTSERTLDLTLGDHVPASGSAKPTESDQAPGRR
jgi:hypothetical protein